MIERFESNGRYHNVIRFQDILFFSGQTATDAGDGIEAQAAGVLRKIDALLDQYGSDKRHILHADVYLRNQNDVVSFNNVWDGWIDPAAAPTRACIVTALGRPQILVEIVVVAAIRKS